jgi:hypothetical protein
MNASHVRSRQRGSATARAIASRSEQQAKKLAPPSHFWFSRGRVNFHAYLSTSSQTETAMDAIGTEQTSVTARGPSFVHPTGYKRIVGEPDSGETTRRGQLAKHGSPELRWALVQAAHQARYRRSPDRALYGSIKARRKAAQPTVLTVARKLARRSYHVLHELEREAA